MEAKTFKPARVTLKSVGTQHTFFSSFKEICSDNPEPPPSSLDLLP